MPAKDALAFARSPATASARHGHRSATERLARVGNDAGSSGAPPQPNPPTTATHPPPKAVTPPHPPRPLHPPPTTGRFPLWSAGIIVPAMSAKRAGLRVGECSGYVPSNLPRGCWRILAQNRTSYQDTLSSRADSRPCADALQIGEMPVRRRS